MPLRALLDNKEFFAWDLTDSDRRKGFICPICKTKFSVVIPKEDKRIKYFRHLVGKAHQENETIEHVNGKRRLVDIATKLGLNWHIEHQIGKHVTDVYIEGLQPLAIEFQCSKCNSAEIADRTQTYAGQGVAVFWILGNNFNKNFYKKTRTKIEREIEKIHATVYFADEKFSVCRNTEAYLENLRLVEDFDIEWHLTNFVKTKLTSENPNLMFKWMEAKKPEPVSYKIFSPSETPSTKVYPIKRTVTPIVDNGPVWTVKRIVSSRKCERCEKSNIEYVATLEIRPNKVLDKTMTQRRVCRMCIDDLKSSFPSAIWKFV